MLIGYARVSTADQSLDLQLDALARAGCECVFEERASVGGPLAGDVVVVWRLDRFGARSRTSSRA